MNTQQIIDKHCTKNPKHIHHPFRFYCLYCKFESTCIRCEDYEHNFCYTCRTELSDKAKDDAKIARNLRLLLKHPILLLESDKTFMRQKYFNSNN